MTGAIVIKGKAKRVVEDNWNDILMEPANPMKKILISRQCLICGEQDRRNALWVR